MSAMDSFQQQGCPFHGWFMVAYWDATPGGRLAHQDLWGMASTLCRPDLIHQVNALTGRLPAHCGGREIGWRRVGLSFHFWMFFIHNNFCCSRFSLWHRCRLRCSPFAFDTCVPISSTATTPSSFRSALSTSSLRLRAVSVRTGGVVQTVVCLQCSRHW